MNDLYSGPPLDRAVFEAASVPAGTLAATERLRREGAIAPALSAAGILELQRSPPGGGGVLRAEPRSELAMERVIDGPAGPLRLRVLQSGEVRACYVHLHGGGWALGGADRQDQTLMRFASAARLAVVSVDYRLAPEHPHPAARADCVAAIRWLAANGQRELGTARLIVAGESAGAHLAALALLALRDRGELEPVAAANLAYGVYDVSMTPSARRWGDQRIVINTPDLAFFAEQYAPREWRTPGRRPDPSASNGRPRTSPGTGSRRGPTDAATPPRHLKPPHEPRAIRDADQLAAMARLRSPRRVGSAPAFHGAVAQTTHRSGASICDGTTHARTAENGPQVGGDPRHSDKSR